MILIVNQKLVPTTFSSVMSNLTPNGVDERAFKIWVEVVSVNINFDIFRLWDRDSERYSEMLKARPMINSFNISYIRNIRGFPTMNCKISWFGVVRFYISVVQSFDRPKLLSLSTWKIWKGEPRIVKIWWMFQIYYHIRVGQTTSLQNKINRAQSWSQSNIFFKRSFIFEWEHENRTPGYLFYFYSISFIL